MRRPHRYMLSFALAAIATSIGRVVAPAVAALAALPPMPAWTDGPARRRRNRIAPSRPSGAAAARRAARKRRARSRGQ